jgi:hypothetical protein
MVDAAARFHLQTDAFRRGAAVGAAPLLPGSAPRVWSPGELFYVVELEPGATPNTFFYVKRYGTVLHRRNMYGNNGGGAYRVKWADGELMDRRSGGDTTYAEAMRLNDEPDASRRVGGVVTSFDDA